MLVGKVNTVDKESLLTVANLTEKSYKNCENIDDWWITVHFNPIIFQYIDETSIAKAAQRTRGADDSNRLIQLKKAPTGIHPIIIGEVLRHIIGKAIIA